MTCNNCIHEAVCNKLCPNGLLPYQSTDYPAEIFCLEFKNQEDVAPVRHGHWVVNDHTEYYIDAKCSVCSAEGIFHRPWRKSNYCPRCGAKLDEEMETNE